MNKTIIDKLARFAQTSAIIGLVPFGHLSRFWHYGYGSAGGV